MWKFKKRWIIITVLLWLVCCQALFVLVQSSFGQKIVESTQGQLRQELDFSNFNFLARSITDYSTSGAIRCAVLDKVTPEPLPILNLKYMSKNCQVSSIQLLGTAFDVKLKSLNGDIYRFQFISNNPLFFDLALWGFRLLGVLAIIGIMLAMQFQAERRRIAYQAEIEVAQKVKQIAMQVSHDIRSPLAALKVALEEIENIPPDYRNMVRMSVQRINDIANNLLSNNEESKQNKAKLDIEFLAPLVDSLVSEKRMSYRHKINIQIESNLAKSYGLFARINSVELKRVISNLINNSLEAMEATGKVTVSISKIDERKILLSISDNGKGMPEHILTKLGEKGFSYGKTGTKSGAGLGLYHAKETIESFDGTLEINSILGKGTIINIIFPKADVPSWFVEKLSLHPGRKVLILDDDESMLRAWSERIPTKTDVFTSGDEFSQAVKGLPEKNFLALVDYELLGQSQTGLELIESLKIKEQSILVTSRFEENELRERCNQLGVRVIPKLMAALIPIQCAAFKKDANAFYDYVYIDDDELMRISWEQKAKKKNISLLVLSSSKNFEFYLSKISKESTQVYIDSQLGEGEVRGEDFAMILHEQGYKNLTITSGYDAQHFEHLNWLKYSGKSCPF